MLSLLPRLQSIQSGTIFVDRYNITQIPLRALRAGVATAFQEVFLFQTSVIENLRYANPKADMEKILDVCRMTGADEVIERLPNGFSTKIGEYGGELSRGEKQRITLARALLKDAPILILDEATASIDGPSAKLIIEQIVERFPEKTIIMVTHDINLLNLAERTIAMEDGQIVFDGRSIDFIRDYVATDLNHTGSPTADFSISVKQSCDQTKTQPRDGVSIPTLKVDREEAEKAMQAWDETRRFRTSGKETPLESKD